MTRLTFQEFIKAYTNPSNRQLEKNPEAAFYEGNSHGGDSMSLRIPEGFQEVEKWADGLYRRVWVNHKEKAVITYCEGDVDVVVCPTMSSYLFQLNDASQFYSKCGEGTADLQNDLEYSEIEYPDVDSE